MAALDRFHCIINKLLMSVTLCSKATVKEEENTKKTFE